MDGARSGASSVVPVMLVRIPQVWTGAGRLAHPRPESRYDDGVASLVRHALLPGGLQIGRLLLRGLVAGEDRLEPVLHHVIELRRSDHIDVVAELHALVDRGLAAIRESDLVSGSTSMFVMSISTGTK